jgi:hypothetical protein
MTKSMTSALRNRSMIDLEQLHTQYGKKTQRGEGQTFDMLVEAIHQTGSTSIVSIVGRTAQHAEHLARHFIQLARDMGYEAHPTGWAVIRVVNPDEGRPTVFDFQSKDRFSKRFGSTEEVFVDHYANA